MEVVGFVGFQDIFLCCLCVVDCLVVQYYYFFWFNYVFYWIEIVKVCQQEVCGVMDMMIVVCSVFEDFVRDCYFVGVVGGSYLQVQDIGVEFVYYVLWVNGVVDRFGYFVVLIVDGEVVGQYLMIWCFVFYCCGNYQ